MENTQVFLSTFLSLDAFFNSSLVSVLVDVSYSLTLLEKVDVKYHINEKIVFFFINILKFHVNIWCLNRLYDWLLLPKWVVRKVLNRECCYISTFVSLCSFKFLVLMSFMLACQIGARAMHRMKLMLNIILSEEIIYSFSNTLTF